MAYWWVSQNKTHRQEREGGYLWAPKRGKSGIVFHHWSNMALVRPGDIVFSYANKAIGAVGVAVDSAYDAPQPAEFKKTWHDDGRRIDVAYRLIEPAVRLESFIKDLRGLLPARRSPITKKGKGVQGYLFAIPPKLGQYICDRLAIETPIEQTLTDAIAIAVPDSTTRDALIKARIGQGRWRRDLLSHWSGKCAVTDLAIEPLLRGSHIKPWRDSDNRERLDVQNGLLLGPAYDAAFDAGLITFADSGLIVISPRFPAHQLIAAGISSMARISALADQHRAYLAHHRDIVFAAK